MEDLLSDPLLHVAPEVDGQKRLEPVALKAKIGAGGMGSVYRGRHLRLDIDVAVKVLDPILAAQGTDFVQRFRREAQLAATIVHPNLVRVFDVLEFEGLHYLVMEYVHGESAMERVARMGPLALPDATRIVAEAALGLAAAHARGVVHRDIKPDNILVAKSGEVKVTDLGLAKALGSADVGLTQSQARMGTPRYMAPEQWEDSKSVGAPADVWSLGATYYYLLAGKHAIEHGSVPEIVRQVCVEAFPDVREAQPRMPTAIAEVIERCTHREASARFPDAGAMAEAMQRLQAEAEMEDITLHGSNETNETIVDDPARMRSEFELQGATQQESPSSAQPPFESPKRSKTPFIIGAAVLFLAVILMIALRGGDDGDDSATVARDADPQATLRRAESEATLSAAVWRGVEFPEGIPLPDELTHAREAWALAVAMRNAGKLADAASAFNEAHAANLATKAALDELNGGQQGAAGVARGQAQSMRSTFDTAVEFLESRMRDAIDEHDRTSLGRLKTYLETEVMGVKGFIRVDARLKQGEMLFKAGQYGIALVLFQQIVMELQSFHDPFNGQKAKE